MIKKIAISVVLLIAIAWEFVTGERFGVASDPHVHDEPYVYRGITNMMAAGTAGTSTSISMTTTTTV